MYRHRKRPRIGQPRIKYPVTGSKGHHGEGETGNAGGCGANREQDRHAPTGYSCQCLSSVGGAAEGAGSHKHERCDAQRQQRSTAYGRGYGFANNYTSRGLPLSFFRDNMPDGTSPQNGYYRTMYDAERIEVLKGPGSALFGVAGPGGSINMITKQPRNAFAASAGTMLGSFGTRNGYMDVTGPIGQSFAGRVITDLEHADGFRGPQT